MFTFIAQTLGHQAVYLLNWKCTFKVRTEDNSWKLDFDGWMYRIDDNIILNRIIICNFGVKVGS